MIVINQLIKIIIGVIVVAVVALGFYFFGGYVNDFFRNVLPANETQKIILSLMGK